jgi:hypothetical protein
MPRTRFTAHKRRQFLDLLRTQGNISYAAAQSGLSRRRLYEFRDENLEFARDWDAALEAGIDALEQEARRRAFAGVKDVEVQYDSHGKIKYRRCKTRYSDTLLIFLLKAARPNKYREVVRMEHIDVSQLSDEELEALARGEGASGVGVAAPAPNSRVVN